MIREVVKFFIVAAFLVAMMGCDRDDDNDVPDMEPGTFEAVITGDVEATLQGVAIFTEYTLDGLPDEIFFTLGMGASDEEPVNIWFVRGGAFPGEGTYDIQPFDLEGMEPDNWFFDVPEFINFSLRQLNQEQQELYFAESGTISFEMVENDTAIRGDFEFGATGSVIGQEGDEPEVRQIQFSGSFYAVFGTVQFPEFTFDQDQ